MFPNAPVYTSVYDRSAMGSFWQEVDVRTSFMQRLSPRLKIAKALLPLYPSAFESFNLNDYDLVLSSSSTFAKGVITPAETCHVCYCYTPTRFAWMFPEYIAREALPKLVKVLLPLVVTPLRVWDYAAAQRVDRFVGISNAVAARIDKFYRRGAAVIEPPVDIQSYEISDEVDDFFLVLSRLQSYKRIDLAVEAATRLNIPLLVAGDGPDRKRLETLAGPNVRFVGRVEDAEARRMLSRCRALLWPGEEDFGLAPVECQASGRPVIAFAAGGALETIVDGETGVLFPSQTVESMVEAISRFESLQFSPDKCRANAARFDISNFVQRLTRELESAYGRHRAQYAKIPAGPQPIV